MFRQRQRQTQRQSPTQYGGFFGGMIGRPQSAPQQPIQVSSLKSLRLKHKSLMDQEEANSIRESIIGLERKKRKRILRTRKRRMNQLTGETNSLQPESIGKIKEDMKKLETKLTKMIKKVSAQHGSVAKQLRDKDIIKNIEQAPPGLPIASV